MDNISQLDEFSSPGKTFHPIFRQISIPAVKQRKFLVYLPMQMLSGGFSPYESMPKWVQNVMSVAPTTQFVSFSQSILFRGAGLEVVWKPFLFLLVIGSVLFLISLAKFRRSVA